MTSDKMIEGVIIGMIKDHSHEKSVKHHDMVYNIKYLSSKTVSRSSSLPLQLSQPSSSSSSQPTSSKIKRYKVEMFKHDILKISQQVHVTINVDDDNTKSMVFELLSETYHKSSDGSIKAYYHKLWNNIYLDDDNKKAYLRVQDGKHNPASYYLITSCDK